MSKLLQALQRKLPSTLHVPGEFVALYEWIEEHGTLVQNETGLWGTLHDHSAVMKTWSESSREGGTLIEFHNFGSKDIELWLGNDELAITERLYVFAQTGGDGSTAAFWLDDEGEQQLVHLGSGSGSTLVCTLASSPLDFLRLLAIGYDEICWPEQFAKEPNSGLDPAVSEKDWEGVPFIHPNEKFQRWVCEHFKTTIPKNALEIIAHPSEMGDANSQDPFWKWVNEHAGE